MTTNTYLSDVAIVSQRSNDTRIRFTHRDRLGSASTFTDHNGQVTAYRSYDPFGAPKGGDWSILGIPQLSANPLDSDLVTRRGFTDHEHLDEAELIHMNGRVYDYNVGRFMSVDPFIVDPGNSQAINPYSYVMNNPLGYTDPSGYIGSRIKDEDGEERSTVSGVKGDFSGVSGSKTHTASVTSGGVTTTVTRTTNSNGSQTWESNSSGGGREGTITGDINSQESVTKGGGDKGKQTAADKVKGGKGNTTINGQARAGLAQAAQSVGMSDIDYGGVGAEYTNIETDENGNENRATIFCDLSCQYEAGEQHLNIMDLTSAALHINMRNANRQGAVAAGTAILGGLSLSAAAIGVGEGLIYYGGLNAAKKIALLSLIDTAVLSVGGERGVNFKDAAGYLVPRYILFLPKTKVYPKPRIKVPRDDP